MSAMVGEVVPIRLNPWLNPGVIARVYRAAGRVHIPDVFDNSSATRIHQCLVAETPWQYVFYDGQEHRELAVASLEELSDVNRQGVVALAERSAPGGFSYRYANFRIFENQEQGLHSDSFLMRVLDFLNGPEFIGLARTLTGESAIDYADAQATLYRAGDFLTGHNDNVAGKNRRAAYVFSFTPQWRSDWGGLLAFPDSHGHLYEAYAPAFNALNLFRVPTLHAVTQVSSFAPAPRYSITGWLRQRRAST
jgi:Rps23 Pro-64 3,4-dihydroxylase Tpa1-like proline 4-hydroxylase